MSEATGTNPKAPAPGLWTKDLYLGAYLLCRGFDVAELAVLDASGRPVVAFRFDGDRKVLEEIDTEYRTGKATANVAMLRFALEKLKDALFERIRRRERLDGCRETMARRAGSAGAR